MRAPTEGWSRQPAALPWRKCGFDSRWALFSAGRRKAWYSAGHRREALVAGARDRGFKSRRPDFDCGGACVGTGGRLLSVTSQVRFLPPQPWKRKGKPTGDGSRPESGRAMSLGGSTPSPSALLCPWPSGRGASLPSWRGGFDSHRALWNDDRGSASGRLPGFEPGDGGSTPPPRACGRRAVSRWANDAESSNGRMRLSERLHVGSIPASAA